MLISTAELFPDPGFQAATESLIEIHRKTEDKAMYDAQEKAKRDYEWAMQSSEKKGKIEGKIQGKIEGKVEGEIKLIHTLQSILLIPHTPKDELSSLTLKQLQELTAELQAKALDR